MLIAPLSSMSTDAPVATVIALIFLPPGPIMRRIMSGFTCNTSNCGAFGESSLLYAGSAFAISPRMCIRASLACDIAFAIISVVRPAILISI